MAGHRDERTTLSNYYFDRSSDEEKKKMIEAALAIWNTPKSLSIFCKKILKGTQKSVFLQLVKIRLQSFLKTSNPLKIKGSTKSKTPKISLRGLKFWWTIRGSNSTSRSKTRWIGGFYALPFMCSQKCSQKISVTKKLHVWQGLFNTFGGIMMIIIFLNSLYILWFGMELYKSKMIRTFVEQTFVYYS